MIITPAIRRHLEMFLDEDLGFSDITTTAIVSSDNKAKAVIRAKEELVIAGLPFVEELFKIVDSEIRISRLKDEGEVAKPFTEICYVEGRTQTLLVVERTALNLLQRLSGIATLTRKMCEKVKGTDTKLVDTRKTTPGLRFFEKYATRVGGATNHRMGLYDAVLIKDNHIKAAGSVRKAVELVKKSVSFTTVIEIEASTLKDVEEALEAGVDIILLDNMEIETLKKAVKMCKGKVLTEASGGVTPENIREIAETGVNFISAGFITHHAPWVDIHMKITEIK